MVALTMGNYANAQTPPSDPETIQAPYPTIKPYGYASIKALFHRIGSCHIR